MAEQFLKDLAFFTPELVLTGTILLAIVTDLIFRRTATPTAAVVTAGLIVAGILGLKVTSGH